MSRLDARTSLSYRSTLRRAGEMTLRGISPSALHSVSPLTGGYATIVGIPGSPRRNAERVFECQSSSDDRRLPPHLQRLRILVTQRPAWKLVQLRRFVGPLPIRTRDKGCVVCGEVSGMSRGACIDWHNDDMAERIRWTREQQLIALRLYMRLPFGKLHSRNPEIISLASHIGRTPSALAMKACNFASLDPDFRRTNRRGLSGASNEDRQLWSEFSENSESLAAEAEAAFAHFDPESAAQQESDIQIPTGETEVSRMIRARRVQSFFRKAVLTSYNCRCAISGLAVPELLVASHIIPWSVSVERRADPRNGICLNALFDRAFDRGLMTIDEHYRVVVSRRLKDAAGSAELECSLREAEGRKLKMPTRFSPAPDAMEHHRQRVLARLVSD